MNARSIIVVAIAFLGLAALVPADAAAWHPVQLCYGTNVRVGECGTGTAHQYPFVLCAGYSPTLPYGTCYHHSYDPSKTADCRGFYLNALVYYGYYVECTGDPNCPNYVDSRWNGQTERYGCSGPSHPVYGPLLRLLP